MRLAWFCAVLPACISFSDTRAQSAEQVLADLDCVPSEERCNNEDDDCDGEVDEPFHVGEACDSGDADTCSAGTWACAAEDAAACVGDTARLETCNGADDDCDGVVDNDFTGACDGADRDACAGGALHCAVDGTAWCDDDGIGQVEERCTLGGDEDCDGETDEVDVSSLTPNGEYDRWQGALAFNGSDYAVIYHDLDGGHVYGFSQLIFARLTANGERVVGSEVKLPPYPRRQRLPEMIYVPTLRKYGAVWVEHPNGVAQAGNESLAGIKVALIGLDGNIEFQRVVNTLLDKSANVPRILYDATAQRFVVIWREESACAVAQFGASSLCLASVGATGATGIGPLQVTGSLGGAFDLVTRDDSVLVSYATSSGDDNSSLMVRAFTGAGLNAQPPVSVSTPGSYRSHDPRFVRGAPSPMLLWLDNRNGAEQIWTRVLTADAFGPEAAISGDIASVVSDLDAHVHGTGVIVVYAHDGSTYLRRVQPGAPASAELALPGTQAQRPRVVVDPQGRITATWRASAAGINRMYATQLTCGGLQ